MTLGLATEMFTTLHDSAGEYDGPAKFRMPSTKSIVGAMEQVRLLPVFLGPYLALFPVSTV
jgi:hypothetical protein